jgi:hypothetical protein
VIALIILITVTGKHFVTIGIGLIFNALVLLQFKIDSFTLCVASRYLFLLVVLFPD